MAFPSVLKTRVFCAICILMAGSAAAGILVVSDSNANTNIVTVLQGEGFTVTSVSGDYATGNATLKGNLSVYDAIYWIADGSGPGSVHSDAALFNNLTGYVQAGGRIFVTGYDSVASPTDSLLIDFVGGTSSIDAGMVGPIINQINSLTVGAVDLRGLTPMGGHGDQDAISGLKADTVGVSGSSGYYSWTLRSLGNGEIAYVSNGESYGGNHATWLNTSADGYGAYNGALRNFAAAIPEPASVLLFVVSGAGIWVVRYARRKYA